MMKIGCIYTCTIKVQFKKQQQQQQKLLKITIDYLHTVIGMVKGIPIPKPTGFFSFLCFVVPGILQIVQDLNQHTRELISTQST